MVLVLSTRDDMLLQQWTCEIGQGRVAGWADVSAITVDELPTTATSWLGERWHSKLARRAVDPAYGPQADAWDRAAAAEYDAHRRAERDRTLQAVTPDDDRHDRHDLDLRDRTIATGEDLEPRYTAEEWAAHQRSGTRPL